jgi:aerobic carbon-monoxide dehydrogenase medium subunit
VPPRPTFLKPSSLDEAIAQLAEYGGDARVVAGSTALTIMLRQGLIDPAALVLLRGIDGLNAIERENGHVRVGALVTHREAERSAELAGAIPVLAETFGRVANVRVRNQATVGGVLAEADYASDPPAVFVGLGAEIEARGSDGTRTIPAGEFFRAFYETALEPSEILTSVRVPVPAAGTVAVYKKYVSRSSEDRPCVGVFASAGPDGVRVVVGAAAETPQTFPEVEALGANGLDAPTIATIAEHYAEAIDTLDDMRGSAWYRREMVRVWVARALAEVAAQPGTA